MLAAEKTPQRSQERQRKRRVYLLLPACLTSSLPLYPLPFSVSDFNWLLGWKFTSFLSSVYLTIYYRTLGSGSALFPSTPASFSSLLPPTPCGCVTARRKALFSTQHKPVVSKSSSTTQINVTAIWFQRAVSSWDSFSLSVISSHSDYLQNED